MKAKETIRYSEAFKQQVIRELEEGKHRSPRGAAGAYGIRGTNTVTGWLRKYGRSDLMPKRITITTMNEVDQKKALEKRVRELEKALADAHMKELLGTAYLGLACEQLGLGVEEFKKKSRHQAIRRVRAQGPVKGVSVQGLCRLEGVVRQGYYRGRRQRQRQALAEETILEAVRAERRMQPRVGTRKLQDLLQRQGLRIGRDRLFELLRTRQLLVEPKRGKVRTTYHDPALPVYRNLLYHLEPTQPHQVWVSDLTYIDTDEGFLFLSLITDLYSRRIVGWNAGDDAQASESVKALRLALASLPAGRWPIHHSDRGSQYCCHDYVAVLQEHDLPISMTEQNHCYENSYAERVNGILKNEFHLDHTFRNRAQARTAIAQAIHTYNTRRPHLSLHLRTPDGVHYVA